ncbi:MAG: hypothetical protein AAF184_14015 [Pseudomonadota bacterium]
MAYLLDRDGLFFYLTARVDDKYVMRAYMWTCIAVVIVIGVSVGLGAHRNQRAFLAKPVQHFSQQTYHLVWGGTIAVSLLLTGLAWRSNGYTVPLLQLLADPVRYLFLRTEARENISQVLLNANLLFLCSLSLVLAAFFLKRNKRLKLLITVLNLLLVGSFTLAKSPIAKVVVITLIFFSCMRPIRVATLAKFGAVFILAVLPLFIVAEAGLGSWAKDRTLTQTLASRVLYGQWAALPFFFEIYEKKRASLGTLQPTYLAGSKAERWSYRGEEAPARQAMRLVTGYRDLESAGVGVAVTFFIGDAYGVFGYPGIVMAAVVVGLEILLLTLVLLHWPRNVLTMFLFTWFCFKFATSAITGFSGFMFGSATYLLLLLAITTFFAQRNRRNSLGRPPPATPSVISPVVDGAR